MGERPVIGFLTDFGLDAAAAICRGVMLGIAPDAQIVDICHTVRKYAIQDGAYLLRSALPWLPVGVHVGVVDPGVGTDRRAVAIEVARGDVLVGPDNGLLLPATERLGGITGARVLANPAWRLPAVTATFHGRDLFAPSAAHLALGASFEDAGPSIDPETLVRIAFPSATARPGVLETGVTYVDSFGNVRLAGGPVDLFGALGDLAPGARLSIRLGGGRAAEASWSRTFGEAAPGELLLYVDSSGDLALAVANGDASTILGAGSGSHIGISRA